MHTNCLLVFCRSYIFFFANSCLRTFHWKMFTNSQSKCHTQIVDLYILKTSSIPHALNYMYLSLSVANCSFENYSWHFVVCDSLLAQCSFSDSIRSCCLRTGRMLKYSFSIGRQILHTMVFGTSCESTPLVDSTAYNSATVLLLGTSSLCTSMRTTHVKHVKNSLK